MRISSDAITHNKADRLAFEQVKAVIRDHSRTFFFATGLLPIRKRWAIRALYAFGRRTDDMVDKENATLADVEAWREQVRKPLADQDDPLLRVWTLTRDAFGVDTCYEDELIDGVAMDINFKPYKTWDDLKGYCYRVASTVGLLSMPIIGLAKGYTPAQAAPFAITLGIALQLTNILRDVGEDLERGRIYFPQDDLVQFGLTLGDIEGQTCDERFIALMKFEIARARDLYAQALPGIAMLHPSARPAVGAAALVYRAILDEIEAIDYRVYDQRAFTSGFKKLRMLPGILWQVWRIKPHA